MKHVMPGPSLSNPDSIFEKVNGYACKNPKQNVQDEAFPITNGLIFLVQVWMFPDDLCQKRAD